MERSFLSGPIRLLGTGLRYLLRKSLQRARFRINSHCFRTCVPDSSANSAVVVPANSHAYSTVVITFAFINSSTSARNSAAAPLRIVRKLFSRTARRGPSTPLRFPPASLRIPSHGPTLDAPCLPLYGLCVPRRGQRMWSQLFLAFLS